MARAKSKRIPDAVREQRQREAKALIAQAVEANYQELGKLISIARESQKLSRRVVSEIAGISEGTLKNLEKGLLKSCSWDTLNRIRMVLNLQIWPYGDIIHPSLIRKTITLNGYRPHLRSEIAIHNLDRELPRLDYYELHSTNVSIDAYQTANASPCYGACHISAITSLCKIVQNIPKTLRFHKAQIICLTIGHGWGEVALVNYLLQADEYLMVELVLVSESEYLLYYGEKAISDHIPDEYKNRLQVVSMISSHETFVRLFHTHAYRPGQRIFCLFGTLMNIEHGEALMRDLCSKLAPGDLLCFDINVAAQPARIYDDDARLCQGKLPREFIATVEQSLQISLQSLQPGRAIDSFEWEYSISDPYDKYTNSMQSYSVHVSSIIHEKNIAPRKISCLRIHRHDPNIIINMFKKFHMRIIEDVSSERSGDLNYQFQSFLFAKL
ncbi:MAG: helix-turn-helix domain-containing protein [Myxococcales bacterium]|nr:helix-turn-helix domain-containing protein [Myxococcales bacterium]